MRGTVRCRKILADGGAIATDNHVQSLEMREIHQ